MIGRPRARPRAMLAALVLGWAMAPAAARAQPGAAPPPPPGPATASSPDAELVTRASSALAAGDPARAADLAGRVAHRLGPVDQQDRAEAWRVVALAEVARDRTAAAADAFYAYLKLEPDAQLDPALVSPEAMRVFDSVRSEHAAELAAMRPRPRRKLSLALSVVPVAGQWQNGDHGKAWLVGSVGAALLATNITTYVLLRRWCGSPSQSTTCTEGTAGQPGYSDHTRGARSAQAINIASGVGLVAVLAYSMVDGYLGYRRLERANADADAGARDLRAPGTPPSSPSMSVGVGASGDGVAVTIGGGF